MSRLADACGSQSLTCGSFPVNAFPYNYSALFFWMFLLFMLANVFYRLN